MADCIHCKGKGSVARVDMLNGRMDNYNCDYCKAGKLKELQFRLLRNERKLKAATRTVKECLDVRDTLREAQLLIQLSQGN